MTSRVLTVAAAIFVTLGAVSLRAQLPKGCGDDATQFKVAHVKHEAPGAAKAGMAQLVLFQKQGGEFNSDATSRFAIDGKWVGADKGTSYFVVDVQPGHHLVCASRQTSAREDKATKTLTVDVVAGQTYYLEFHVQRMEIGDASASHAGMNGSLAAAGKGYTPDMTLRSKDTMDAADFDVIEGSEADLHKVPVSVSRLK